MRMLLKMNSVFMDFLQPRTELMMQKLTDI